MVVATDGFIVAGSEWIGVIAEIDGFDEGCSECTGVPIDRLRRSCSESGGMTGSGGKLASGDVGSRTVLGLMLMLDLRRDT